MALLISLLRPVKGVHDFRQVYIKLPIKLSHIRDIDLDQVIDYTAVIFVLIPRKIRSLECLTWFRTLRAQIIMATMCRTFFVIWLEHMRVVRVKVSLRLPLR